MRPAVLFDLGNTLAEYYRPDEFRPILDAAIADVLDELRTQNRATVLFEAAISIAVAENQEAADYRFKPMEGRLERIFKLNLKDDSLLANLLCERFLSHIFALGRLCDDALPVLNELRASGHPTAIVSNAPWGSPPDLWRRELERLGLVGSVDRTVLCGDVGWRKPAPEIFKYAAHELGRSPNDCIFVGDDLHWDIGGSAAVGMHPILIDRDGRYFEYMGDRVGDLYGVLPVVETWAMRVSRTS